MRMILMAGLITVLGGGASPPTRTTEPKRPANEIGRPEAHVSQPVCAIRELRADPHVDPDMTKSMDRAVDSRMVVPSPCRKSGEVTEGDAVR